MKNNEFKIAPNLLDCLCGNETGDLVSWSNIEILIKNLRRGIEIEESKKVFFYLAPKLIANSFGYLQLSKRTA